MGWKDAPEVGGWASAPLVDEGTRPEAGPAQVAKGWRDYALGGLAGAGDIGSALIELGRSGGTYGQPFGTILDRIKERKAGIEGGNQALGADVNSLAYGGGKITTQVLGTMGTGGALANMASKVLVAARAAPNLLQAIRTSGMTGGNAMTRAAGGAVVGGSAAGLVDPESAGMGTALGGAAPGAFQLAGKAGNALGRVISGPALAPDAAQAVTAARNAGYVIPPTQAKPSLTNRMLEGFSGKITTAQNASAKNQVVTNKLAAEAIGLPADVKISPDVLNGVRARAGQAYEAISQAGTIRPGEKYAEALDRIVTPHLQANVGFPAAKPSPVIDLINSLRSDAFDASSAVAKIKELRSAADDAFRTGNTDVARASKAASKALEDAVEEHLAQSGATDLLAQFRDARQLIAKTYSVEKALNPSTGTIDARKLAAQLAKGKPLSGELKSAAEFAQRFPKAAQSIEGMGSLPQTSPLDWAAMGTISAATSNPLMMAGVLARPAARAAVLSGPVQNRLTSGGANPLQALANPDLQQFLLRATPGASASR